MKKIRKCKSLFSLVPALLLVIIGMYLAIEKPLVKYIVSRIRQDAVLIDGTSGYTVWKNSDVFFNVYLFQVTNPKNVMKGEAPMLEERGPYVYDIKLEKHVTKLDEENDEMAFTVYKTYRFNKAASGSLSDEDEIVMLNSAYLGTVNTMVQNFEAFIGKLGTVVIKLFPGARDIFLRGKVKNILFEGLPLVCDKEKYKDLGMLCNFLRGKKPPLIRNTDELDHYIYSYFAKINTTEIGPFTVNRGSISKEQLGNTTSFKNIRKQRMWNEPSCNVVSGTDSITWPPMTEKLPFVEVFEPNLCRTLKVNFKNDEIIHGVNGYKYELNENTWTKENIECYCPLNKKKEKECLVTGLMDISKCQEAPVIFSEPHFLHADPKLLEYARGLKGDEDRHSTFIVIEPTSGAPLKGSKKMQLNLKAMPIPSIPLLSNLSEGYFPMLWVEETNTATVEQLSSVIKSLRLLNVVQYLAWMMIILGIFLIVRLIWLQTVVEFDEIQLPQIIISSNSSINQRLINQRPGIRTRAFE